MKCDCSDLYKCSACGCCYFHDHGLKRNQDGLCWWVCPDGYTHPAFLETGQWKTKPDSKQIQFAMREDK